MDQVNMLPGKKKEAPSKIPLSIINLFNALNFNYF